MKKYIPLILCTALMCSCSNSEEAHTSVAETSAQQTTVATDATESTEAQTTESKTEATTKNEHGKLFCIYSKTGLTLKMDGAEKNFIELEAVPKADQTVIADFNFDGYEDIFVPLLDLNSSGLYGDYWLYSPEEDSFVISDELAVADGMGYKMEIYQDSQLEMSEYNSYGSTYTYFKWNDDKLTPVSFNDHYYLNSDKVIDNYEFDSSGEKYLVSRTFVNPSNGARYKTVDNPVYFKVTDTTVDYMMGRDIIQQIDNHNLPQLVEKLKIYSENYSEIQNTPLTGSIQVLEPEKYLATEDFDFDGYTDLAIPISFYFLNKTSTYFYYHYDSASDKYVSWDELNNIGQALYLSTYRSSDEQYLYTNVISNADGERYYYEYKWFGDELKLTEKHIYYGNSNNAKVITYDENGNEISRKTKNYIRDDFTQ